MFNLTETIQYFNQAYQTRIKLNKTWGLMYLQPQSLAFLNQCPQLIQDSVYYASPFSTQHRALRATLAKTQDLPVSETLPLLKTIVQQLKTDEHIRQRLDWEDRLRTLLNEETFWQQRFNQIENNPRVKHRLRQIYQDWKQHQPFQYHSSRGLLFLLDVVVEYQYHFTQAHQELERKQQAWLSSQRLPWLIAESYRRFLERELNQLKVLQQQMLEVLLLRLKIAEQRKQVTWDDVSYSLIEQGQQLNLPLFITLPKHQRTLDVTTFNQIHRAIEKYGNAHHKQQLYRLAWYHYTQFNAAKDITLVMVSGHRLLVPTALLHLLPKKARKPGWLFRSNQARLAFLEKQQALLAQLTFPVGFIPLSSNSPSTLNLTLKSFILRYQLLHASLQSLEQQPAARWWWWRQKHWEKAWNKWLMQQFRKNQENLYKALNHFLQNHEDGLSQAIHHQPLQDSLIAIQHLIEQGHGTDRCPRLTFLIKHFLRQLQAKTEESAREKQRAVSLMQNFKQDLSTALEAYINYCHKQGRVIPEARVADIGYLRQLLNTTHDFLPLREGVRQRYQTMQRPQLAKLITSLDGSVLRYNLQAVLENPNYRVEQFKHAVTVSRPPSQEVLDQKNNLSDSALKNKESTVDRHATFSSISVTTNTILFTLEQQLAQMQTQLQSLMNNTNNTNPFLKSPDTVKNPSRFFKSS
jgi:hypothetical protein